VRNADVQRILALLDDDVREPIILMPTESVTDLLMTEMLVRPPMEFVEVQGILSLPIITASELFSFFITIYFIQALAPSSLISSLVDHVTISAYADL
jgi:hypothetical protein